jgi:hypothetical protein
MQLSRKSILSILIIGILTATLVVPETHAVQNLWGWVRKEQRYVTSSQSLAGSQQVSGTFVFSIGISNPGPSSVRGATIAFTSTRTPLSLISDTGGIGSSYAISGLSSGNYRYTWTVPDILPKSDQQVWIDTPITSTFSPGFDSSHEVTPTLLESQIVPQEIKIRVKPTQQFFGLNVGISLEGTDYVNVKMVKGSDRPALRYRSNTWISWWIDRPQTNRVYEFSVRIETTSLVFPSKVDFAPWMEVMAYESQRVDQWSSREWHGTSKPDPDISVWDVAIGASGNSESNVGIEIARTVGFWHPSAAQLRTEIVFTGLPFLQSGQSPYLYKDRNGLEYSLIVDDAAKPVGLIRKSESVHSVMFWLSEGYHVIAVPQIFLDNPGTRYYCEENTLILTGSQVSAYLHNYAFTHTLVGAFTHTFGYVKQFLLKVDPGIAGNQTVKWIDASSSVVVRTDALVQTPLGVRYNFLTWKGSIDANSSEVSFVMDKPVNMTAQWTADYTLPVLGGVVAAVSAGSLTLVATRRTKQTRPKTDYDTLLQRLETLKASGSISDSAYARLRAEYEKHVQDS